MKIGRHYSKSKCKRARSLRFCESELSFRSLAASKNVGFPADRNFADLARLIWTDQGRSFGRTGMLPGDPWWGAVVLVRKHAPALNIRRTVRHHTRKYPLDEALPGGRGGAEPFDGVAEVWCDSKWALIQATATPSPASAAKSASTQRHGCGNPGAGSVTGRRQARPWLAALQRHRYSAAASEAPWPVATAL